MQSIEPYVDPAIGDIEALCGIPSPSGFTAAAARYVADRLARFAPTLDAKGGVWCRVAAGVDPSAPAVALSAHFDTLGAMVRSAKPNGRLRFTKVGGYPELYLIGHTCRVHTRSGREYEGTFQAANASVHVNNKLADFKAGDETVEIVLDEPVSKKEDVAALGISPGDFVSIDARFSRAGSGYIKSRHLDDKAGCGILLALADAIAAGAVLPRRPSYLYFTAYEEVGHGASFLPEPVADLVSVDMGAVGDDLECDERKVSICAKDSGGPYDYVLSGELIDAAKRAGVPFAVDVYPFYGSDAEAAIRSGYELRHGLVGPGVYASHGYARTHREAISAALGLLAAFLEGGRA
jgi:putative aminopeptidase FrvX